MLWILLEVVVNKLTQCCAFYGLTLCFQNHVNTLWETNPEAESKQPGLWQCRSAFCTWLCRMRVVFSARTRWWSWTRKIRRLCVSWFNCHVAYLFEKRFMNNKCTSIKSKIRFSSAAILPAISSPLFFPITFIFKMRGFIFHLQNHHTQECKSGVTW